MLCIEWCEVCCIEIPSTTEQYVHVAVDFRNQNALYIVCELSIDIQMHVYLMVREKNGMYNTGTTKLCLVTVEEVEKMDTMHSRMTMEKQRIKKQ